MSWHDHFLSREGPFRWRVWDETQSECLGEFWFKWRALRFLRRYGEALDAMFKNTRK